MNDIAIRVEKLRKQYRLGFGGLKTRHNYTSLRDVLTKALCVPFRRRVDNLDSKIRNTKPEYIWALNDLSFEIKHGEVIGVIGPNGAGKTTLLKILSRITEPTSGWAKIHGRVRSLLEVGTGFHPELSGRENIYLNGAILGMRKVETNRKFDEIVAFADVEKFIDTPVKRYSSGMYVRLAFAVAAHLEPEILLVDEVLAVGDYEFQKKCLKKMGEVSKEGRTVLFVSHNMMSINNLCSRALLLEQGKIAMDGETSDVIQRYIVSVGTDRVKWEELNTAPGNHRTRLHSVEVLSSEGNASGEFDIDQDILIRIAYWNLQDGEKFLVGIWLKDELGNIVLTSTNIPPDNLGVNEWFDRPHPVGLFETVCRIPANLLNSKMYSVDVFSNNGFKAGADFHIEGAVSFRVSETKNRNVYNLNWIGVVRPKLVWTTEYRSQPTTNEPHNHRTSLKES